MEKKKLIKRITQIVLSVCLLVVLSILRASVLPGTLLQGYGVDSNGNVYLGMEKAIEVYTADGEYIRSLSPRVEGRYEFYMDQDVIFLESRPAGRGMDWSGRRFDTEGNTVLHVTGGQEAVSDGLAKRRTVEANGSVYTVKNYPGRFLPWAIYRDGLPILSMNLFDYVFKGLPMILLYVALTVWLAVRIIQTALSLPRLYGGGGPAASYAPQGAYQMQQPAVRGTSRPAQASSGRKLVLAFQSGSEREFCSSFQRQVALVNSSPDSLWGFLRLAVPGDTRFRGNVQGNSFWIMEGNASSALHKVFRGRLLTENGQIRIEGSFRHSIWFFLPAVLSFFVFLAIGIFVLPHFDANTTHRLLFCCIVPLLLPAASVIAERVPARAYENRIVSFLQTL